MLSVTPGGLFRCLFTVLKLLILSSWYWFHFFPENPSFLVKKMSWVPAGAEMVSASGAGTPMDPEQ